MNDAFADALADLQRRVRALETAPRGGYTTVRGGATIWRPPDGDASILLGASGADVVLQTYERDGVPNGYIGSVEGRTIVSFDNVDHTSRALWWDSLDGLKSPGGLVPWCHDPETALDANGRATTTSSAYRKMWQGLGWATSKSLGLYTYALASAGATSGQVKVTITPIAVQRASGAGIVSTAAAETTVDEFTADTSSVTYQRNIDLTDALWSPAGSPVGELYAWAIYGRVSAGAGSCLVAPLRPGWHY